MNFDLTEEQQILVESVQRFVQEESGPERDAHGEAQAGASGGAAPRREGRCEHAEQAAVQDRHRAQRVGERR